MEENKLKFGLSENESTAKTPLDSLKERMLAAKATGESVKPAAQDGFSVELSTKETEKEPQISFDKIEIPNITDESEAFEDFGEEDEDAESQDEEASQEESVDKPKKFSFLKRIRRYTTDDNGVDVTENEKPLYELDSVNSILGIEEEEKDEEEPTVYDITDDSEDEAGETGVNENGIPYISDIDKSPIDMQAPAEPEPGDTATIRFTPVSEAGADKPTVSVDTMTHKIDLGEEISEPAAIEQETDEPFSKSGFDSFVPAEEITDRRAEKRWLRNFALKKRNRFLVSVLSGVCSLVLLIFLLPPIANAMLLESTTLMTVSLVILGVMIIANADMFASLLKIGSAAASSDSNAALLSVSTVLLGIFSIKNGADTYPMFFICAFVLFIRSLMRFYDISNKCGNLAIISVNRPKKAVTLISDKSVADAMVSNLIDGKALVATSRVTDRVTDFMKYTEYGETLSGKLGLITLISFALSAVFGLIGGLIKHSTVEAFYLSSLILSMAAIPILFFIDSLPLRSMISRLTLKGAMITGFTAAEQLNTANAVVIKTSDMFPRGTVVLKDIKVLSDCNVDDIILRAASLTEAANSPLSGILKQIAKTNAAYDVPSSDTVRYEELLGISGWVNNERLFIGNRTLMQGHGIEVPELDYDHAILRSGYFPIYIAKDNKASVLLIVKYTADLTVKKQLHDAIDLGITVLMDTSDPNLNDKMISDYFELEPTSFKVMTGVGSNVHKNATTPMEECSAGAAYKGNSLSLLQIMISTAKLKKSNTVLTVIYAIAAILGIVYFVYGFFLSDATLVERASTVLIYEIAATAVSLVAFLIKRP